MKEDISLSLPRRERMFFCLLADEEDPRLT